MRSPRQPAARPAHLALGGLALLALLAAAFYGRVAMHSWRDLHPPRLPVDPAIGRALGAAAVSFASADGVPLRGWYRAAGPAGATVLLVHGSGAQRTQMAPQAQALVDAGYGVLLFDLRAHGESGGTLSTSGYLEQRDVEAALAWLRARPGSTAQPIVAVGFSIGGIAVADVAARDPGIAAVVLESTPPTLAADHAAETPRHRPFEDRLYAWIQRRAASVPIESVRPVDDLCRIAPRPVLVAYGSDDTYVGPEDRQAMLHARCPPSATWLAEGSGHEQFVLHPGQGLTAVLLAFLQAAVGPR
jgi:pimeloyl-ACP methyl ester carboxylesterase